MSNTRKFLFCLLASAMLCGCGQSSANGSADSSGKEEATPTTETETTTAEGKYVIVGTILDDYVVKLDVMDGWYVELAKDSDGYLYLGEDNKGPISSWEYKDGKFNMKAGISNIDGELKDGILTLDMGDNMYIVFARADADTSSLKIMTLDEYSALIGAEEKPLDAASIAGFYELYVVEKDGYYILAETGFDPSTLTINEDGTCVMTLADETENMTWVLNENSIVFTDSTGDSSDQYYKVTVEPSVIKWEIPIDSGTNAMEYYVRDDFDRSSIKTITMEEYRKLTDKE